MGAPRILVAIPALSFKSANESEVIRKLLDLVPPVGKFKPTQQTLDVFPKELSGLRPKKMWGINIPHWPLEETNCKGVAGPGLPGDELFRPPEIGKQLKRLCGEYDKWRPYPATPPISPYNIKIAKRFAKKRCRMFKEIADTQSWDTLFYVEHSPASLAHLDEDVALEIAENVIEEAVAVSRSWSNAFLVIFSPYGIGKQPGFVVSNIIEGSAITSWDGIRHYINGIEKF